MRALARRFRSLDRPHVIELLRSSIHEDRMIALLILVLQAKKADVATQKEIYQLYLAHTRFINNWDLVDASAPSIVGGYLAERSRKPLHRLAPRSPSGSVESALSQPSISFDGATSLTLCELPNACLATGRS